MPKNQKSINLLPQEEFEGSVTGRVLKWTMSTFRYIVIVTEMIVMGAFLSRFWLDAKNADLSDSLKIKTAQIQAQSDFEKSFRDFQSRISILAQLEKNPKPTVVIGNIVSGLPSDVALSAISYQDSLATLKGVSASEIGVAQFIANLKADKSFKKITLGQITSSQLNQLETVFNVDLTY
jgi:Tfp pilus assembly protein PilN